MIRTLSSSSPWAVAILCAFSSFASAAPEPPARLRCEWLVEPRNVETDAPRFSWEVRDARRGAVQSAYELHVGTTPALAASDSPDVWSSGVVESRETMNVEYAGPALRAATAYSWTVRTRDARGEWSARSAPTSFATGVSVQKEWGSAQWIGDPTPAPASRPANNGFHTSFADTADTEKWVMIDLGERRKIDRVTLWPSRPHDFSPDTPGFCFPLRYVVEAADDAAFGTPVTLADRTAEDAANPGKDAVVLEVTPTEARYVRLRVPKLRLATPGRYAFTLAEMEVSSKGKVVSHGAGTAVKASDSIEHNDWSAKNLADGDLVSHKSLGWEALPAPMLRREFGVQGDITRATLYITALGVYEARLNGERVGDQQLAPEWTDYDTRVQYQAYDVTHTLNDGGNAIGVILGDGWYAGRIGMAQQFTDNKRPRAVYGRFPRLLAQLRIEKADGSVQHVVTDGSWTSTVAGAIRSSDMLDGEVYDARREMTGFDKTGFTRNSAWTPVAVDAAITTAVVAQPNEPIRVIQTIKPISMNEPKPGVYVFDLGQNMPGWCRIHVKGASGATVRLRHVEAVNDDGTAYTANLRGAPQVDRYTLSGRPEGETWEPRFTYHGFRFVEWTGDAAPPTIDSLEGIVITTDAPMAGAFECSSPMLNQLWSNILWTQHANTMSVPTDCPQRDERLGWMGDILAFGQTAAFNKDMAAFYSKWLLDVRDAQADDGRFPDVAPHPFGKNRHFTGVPAWGDAGVFVPWCSYENYADTRLIAAHFDAARRWVDWIESKNPDLLWKNARHNDYNDWLNGDSLIAEGWPRKGGEAPRDVFATAFFARSTHLVAEMAKVLGREEEAEHYADLHSRIRAAFNAAFVGPDAKLPGDTQAEYALALGFDLLPAEKRPAAVAHLVRGIDAYKGHLSTGFHSTHHAMIELTRAGHADLAYTLATSTSFPSWGYSIENGATTIWERWDGYVKGRGFQDPGMNSLNHWALGSVGEWMMRTIIGINNDPATPGWSHFELRPLPGGGLTHAKGSFHSPRGVIESAWRTDGNAVVYDFTIPANTTARVRLAAPDAAKIIEGGNPLNETDGVKVVAADDGEVAVDVGAGKYTFRVLR